MRVVATARQARISPQKARLIADQVRGKHVEEAGEILMFGLQKGAALVSGVLNSAIANAENNYLANVDELYISEIYVNEAQKFRRYRARARGRGARIVKRMSHITVVLSDGIDDEIDS